VAPALNSAVTLADVTSDAVEIGYPTGL